MATGTPPALNWNANAAAYAEPAVVTFPDLVEAVNGVNEVNVTANRSPFSVTISNTGDFDTNAYSFSGTGGISGSTGITKTGAGLVTFSNPNSYSGTLAINGGAVIKTAADTTSGNITVADTASFVLSGGITDGSGQTITIAGPGHGGHIISYRPPRIPARLTPVRFRQQHLGRQHHPHRHRRHRRQHPHRRSERSHPHAQRQHQRERRRHEPLVPCGT